MENAAAYAGGTTLVSLEAAGEGVIRIVLDDEVPGVPPEEREAIFGRFARGQPGSRRAVEQGQASASPWPTSTSAPWGKGLGRGGPWRRGPLRARTVDSGAMSHRRGPVVAIVLTLVVAGCSVPIERSARVEDDKSVPFSLLDEDAPPLVSNPADVTSTEEACFVADRMLVTVAQAVAGTATARKAIRTLASPPAQPPGLTTAVVDDGLVASVQVDGGLAHVDLMRSVASSGSDAQLLLIAQIVCTLTSLPGIGQVAFRLDGAPVQVPTSDGSIASGPGTRDDYGPIIR